LSRLAKELSTQIERFNSTATPATSAIDHVGVRLSLADSDATVKQLEVEYAQTQAILGEADRKLIEKRVEAAGIERRLQAIQAFLDQLDAEFVSAGLQRDITALVEAESRATKLRTELATLKAGAGDIVRQLQAVEEGRALQSAKQRLSEAERSLRAIQQRQSHLRTRSDQFKTLYGELEALQNDSAESVVRSIREPANVLFHAMTAGCPWDLDFRLEDGKLGAVLTDGSARDVSAMSVLNSAYVNVAAIALRLALASQQRWTRLRAIVLDDPILEMDHLTQSALIDGLEAILTSPSAPWQDLQFVVTTWSEDFAVMAAHKLAHLNEAQQGADGVSEQFVIHRLSSDPEGRTASQRHVPRWRKTAAA
jgi:DNA repair exonuclease SbcCD ATPase subunit